MLEKLWDNVVTSIDRTLQDMADSHAGKSDTHENAFDYTMLEKRANYYASDLNKLYLSLYDTKVISKNVDDELDELIAEFHPNMSKEERDNLKKESLNEVVEKERPVVSKWDDEQFVLREKMLIDLDVIYCLTERADYLWQNRCKFISYKLSAKCPRNPYRSGDESTLGSIGIKLGKRLLGRNLHITETPKAMLEFLKAAADIDYGKPDREIWIEGKVRPVSTTYKLKDLFTLAYEKISTGQFELNKKELKKLVEDKPNQKRYIKKILNEETIADDMLDYVERALRYFVSETYLDLTGKGCNTNLELVYDPNEHFIQQSVTVHEYDYKEGEKFKNFKYNNDDKACAYITKAIESF